MGQDAGWYGGRPGPGPRCARWGPSFRLPKKGAQPPIFGPCPLWPNGWMDQDATLYGGRPRPRDHCVRWGPSSTPSKGHSPSPICGPSLLWPNGRMDQDVTWYEGRCRPRREATLCYIGIQLSPLSAHVYCGQTVANLSYC